MASPKVSVILPTYNRPVLLARAIESVLAQTFSDWELLVVDNGSTDSTEEMIRKFQERDKRIRYLMEKKKGAGAARNRGLKESQGKWFAFLDDDDEWLPEKLTQQAAFVESHPEMGLLYAQAYVKDRNGKTVGMKPSTKPALNFLELIRGNTIPLLTVLVRRRCLEKVGGFVESFQGVAEDYNLWLRVAKEFPIGYLPQPLAVYHLHDGNMSKHPLRRYQGYQAILSTFNGLLKSCHDPSHIKKIKQRLALTHYFFARQHIFLDNLSEARRHLKEARSLMVSQDFPRKRQFLLKSFVLSWLLLGGPIIQRFLSWRWGCREADHFLNPEGVSVR